MAITINTYFTDSANGNDRRVKYASDYTSDILLRATHLLQAINALLVDLGVISIVVTSGWRPPSVNVAIGGAKSSAHCTGEACDLADAAGTLKRQLEDNPDLLIKHDLYMEDPSATKTWCHLQTRATKSGKRIFKP